MSKIEITTDQELKECCRSMTGQPFVAMDTEFIRERTYYPVLALVQVAWRGQDPILIDPLGINDWGPFHEILDNSEIVKVFHAGRQDLEIFFHQMNRVPTNIYDTQIAASMCGFGDQIGYGALVSKLLGVQLTKGSSYTNWLQRPLTDSQMRYARDDVLYLIQVYEKLHSKSVSRNREVWIQEEMDEQLHAELFDPDPDDVWRKVKKARSLKEKDAPVLQELARWRDAIARKINKPVRFILSDEAMIELAKIEMLSLESLRSRRGIQSGFIDRYGDAILECHRLGRARPKAEWPGLRTRQERPPSEKAEELADLAWLLIKEIANKAHMAPTNLIAKSSLSYYMDSYLRGKDLSSFPISHGWRREMVGELLTRLIDGKLTIRVQNHRIVWQDADTAG